VAIQRRSFVLTSAALGAGLTWASQSRAATPYDPPDTGFAYLVATDSPVLSWNRLLLRAIANTQTQATVAARACSLLNEAIYNAWAAYDTQASFTLAGMARRPVGEKSSSTLAMALSYAAYLVLVDLFPTQKALFDARLSDFYSLSGFAPGSIAQQVGQLAGTSLLQARHGDLSNQLGDIVAGAYADYTGYVAVNPPDRLIDYRRWQPRSFVNASGQTVVQQYLTPQWGLVRPFALISGSQFRPVMQHTTTTWDEADQLLAYSAALDDNSKSLVELWAANPGTVSPPGQWMQIAEQVALNDRYSEDQNVKLFFAAAQAVHDAGVASWDCRRYYDSIRPITLIPYYYAGRSIIAWAGYNQGIKTILGQTWIPYQRSTAPTPPFPEYCSGHSTFSACAAAVIAGLRGSDAVTVKGRVLPGGITFEMNTPKQQVDFTWATLSDAAHAAGLSRRIGGIHFQQADLDGRALGEKVGAVVLAKCQALFAGQGAAPQAVFAAGLTATYSVNGSTVATRVEAVNFSWGATPPPGVSSTAFTARWTGSVTATVSGWYLFQVVANGGVRLTLNGFTSVNDWIDRGQPTTVFSSWVWGDAAARIQIALDYFNSVGPAAVQLRWITPNANYAVAAVPPALMNPT